MFWLGIIVGAAPAALIATLIAYDRGLNRANREWSADSFKRHIETKYQLGLAGLSINSHRTEQ
jgi:hypothetical protein